MRCDEFERVLHRQLDGERMPNNYALLRQHALHCDSCRDLQDGMQLLSQHFQSHRIPAVSLELTDRICAAACLTPPRSRVRRLFWLAAAAALLASIGLRMRSSSPHDSVDELAQRTLVSEGRVTGELPFPELTGSEATDPRQSMAIMEAVEPVSRLFQAVGRSLGSPIRPIAVSTSEAMSNLIKDLPDLESSPIPIPSMSDMMGTPPAKKMQGMTPSS